MFSLPNFDLDEESETLADVHWPIPIDPIYSKLRTLQNDLEIHFLRGLPYVVVQVNAVYIPLLTKPYLPWDKLRPKVFECLAFIIYWK